jgi:hypothetical protein
LEKALEISGKSCATNNPLLVEIYRNNAEVLDALGRHEEAVNNAKKSVDVARRIFGLNHPKTKMVEDYLHQIQYHFQ